MNTPPPLLTRLRIQLKRPLFLGPLAFVAGTFWIHTILNNFNSEKCHSSLFRGIIYSLRNHEEISALIGPSLAYDQEKHRRVKGGFDNFKGVADLEFEIEGEHGAGTVVFRGRRYRETDCWISEEFLVRTNSKTFDL
jgi:hypothetical protein